MSKITSSDAESLNSIDFTNDDIDYVDDIRFQRDGEPITLTAEEAEQIEDLLYGYKGALDNILYERYSVDELENKLALIDSLINKLS
jgi:hypothetical protein